MILQTQTYKVLSWLSPRLEWMSNRWGHLAMIGPAITGLEMWASRLMRKLRHAEHLRKSLKAQIHAERLLQRARDRRKRNDSA